MIPYANGPIATVTIAIGTLTFAFDSAVETPPVSLIPTGETTEGEFALELMGNLTSDTSGTFITGALASTISTAALAESCTQAPINTGDRKSVV